MRRTIVLGLVLLLVFLGGASGTAAAVWWFWPTPQVRAARAAARRAPAARAADRSAGPERAKAAPRSGARPHAGPTARALSDRSAAAAREDFMDLSPEERLEYRQTHRNERLSDLDARLDEYAAEAAWDPDLTEEVRILLIETTDGISERMERVDRGDAVWEDERDALRDFRLAQAGKLEGLLGEEFVDFVDRMQFTRFVGDTTVHDRLEAREARATP